MARNPDSIFFAIALQYKKIPLPDLSEYYGNPNFNFVSYDVDTRPGVNQVRHNLLKFYNNQTYYMMIDSHTTFMKDWDIELIKDYKILKAAKQDKVVLSRQSTSPCGNMCECDLKDHPDRPFAYCPGHQFITKWHIPEIDEQYDNKIILSSLRADPAILDYDLVQGKDFVKTHYTCCSFLFVDACYIHEVGVCDGMSFLGEEPSQGIRAFYAGWDVYAQTKTAYIQHDTFEYNFELYGSRDRSLVKPYAKPEDYLNAGEDRDALVSLFVNNSGKYYMPNAVRTSEQFFEEIGLINEFKEFLSQQELEKEKNKLVTPYSVYMDEYEKVGYSKEGILQFKNFVSEDDLNTLNKYISDNKVVGSINKSQIKDSLVLDTVLRIEERLYRLVDDEYYKRYSITIKRNMCMGGLDLTRWQIGDSLPIHSDAENYNREPILFNGWYRSNVTVIIYLTNNFEGGEIVFPEFDLSIKPEAGELFVYPGRYRHRVNKLISGQRHTAIGAFEFDVVSTIEDIFDNTIDDPSKLLFEGYEN